MSPRHEYLRLRRELLVSLAEAQRTEIGYLVARLSGPLRLIDTAIAAGRALNTFRLVSQAGLALFSRRRKGVMFWTGVLLLLRRAFARRRGKREP
jgi:hypothetical protein